MQLAYEPQAAQARNAGRPNARSRSSPRPRAACRRGRTRRRGRRARCRRRCRCRAGSGAVGDAQPRGGSAGRRRHKVAAAGSTDRAATLARLPPSPAASARRLRPSAPSDRSPAACPTPSRSATSAPGPTDGRSPTTPQNDAGMRSEPPRSVPSASAIMPVASATAPPPVDPPALFDGFHGLRVAPKTWLKVLPPAANSGQLVLPMMTAPARAEPRHDGASSVGHVLGEDRRSVSGAQRRRPA